MSARASGTQMLHVHGTEPDWTKSPWWSFFTNDSAKKIAAHEDNLWPEGGPWLVDDDVPQTVEGLQGGHAGTHTAHGGVEFQYAKPSEEDSKKLGSKAGSGKGPWEPWLEGHGAKRQREKEHEASKGKLF